MRDPFVIHLHCPLLRRSVIVVAGSREATLPRFLKAFKGYETTPKMLKDIWARLCEKVSHVREEYPQFLGCMVPLDGDMYIVLPKWSRSVFVHEAYHATRAILREINTDDEELGAYILEWLFEKVVGRDPARRRR